MRVRKRLSGPAGPAGPGVFLVAAILLPLLAGLLAAGCGGGGGGTLSTPLRLDINWAERTRAVAAPASALSAVVRVNPSFENTGISVELPPINRSDTPGAYTQSYVSPASYRIVGQSSQVGIVFYSGKDGQGDVVGVAGKPLSLVPQNGDLGDVDTAGTVTQVVVTPGQNVAVTQAKTLMFSALDAAGNTLAVSPGSARWAFSDGGGTAAAGFSLAPDGTVTGKAISVANVIATVDNVTSPAAPVNVVIGPETTTTSGLKYQEMALGTGAAAEGNKRATVNYVGRLPDGTVFDSSLVPGRTPFTFTVGSGVIAGFSEGVSTMKVGGKRRLIIPPALGYGANPPPGSNIPANATLIFDIDLLSVP